MIGNHLEPFKFWCQKVLPNVYDDSLSYYEYLCKLNEYLNEVIGQINTLTDNMEDYEADLTATWLETKEYIDNYFNNLDVQEEINNKLDQMASSGELSTLLAPIVGTQIGEVVANQIGATVANQIDGVVAEQIDGSVASQIDTPVANATADWLSSHIEPTTPVIDNTLTVTGAGADAKVTGDDIRIMGQILNNLVTPETDIKTVSILDGTGNIFASNEFQVYSDKDYFLYCKVKIIGLATWNAGYMYTRLLYAVDAGGWNDTQIRSISDQGEYVMAYNLRPTSSGTVKLNLYFNNQNPTTNSFQVKILKAFVVETNENLRDFFDEHTQADKVLIRLNVPNKTIHNYMLADDAFSPVTDTTIIDCWGDSLTQGAGSGTPEHPYTERLQALIGNNVVVNNYGQGSETAESISFRQGGLNAIVQPFTCASFGHYAQIPILTSLDGVPLSELSVSGKYHGNNIVNIGGYNFMYRRINNTTSQLATIESRASGHVFSRPEIVYASGEGTRHIMLVCMGQNGYGRSDVENSPEFLANLHQRMIDYNNSDYYLVLGIPTGNLSTMKECESILASRFGKKFVNLREYISAYGLSDNNITPTQEDLDAMNVGAIPPSLRADTVHMNQYGYIAMANCIYERGKTLGYW